jgi:hypothetical protein
MVDQPVSRPLPTRRTTQTQNKCTQTSMPRMGFKLTFPAFEQVNTVHTLDRAATVLIGRTLLLYLFIKVMINRHNSYLALLLLSTIYKVLSNLLIRLTTYICNIMGYCPYGF